MDSKIKVRVHDVWQDDLGYQTPQENAWFVRPGEHVVVRSVGPLCTVVSPRGYEMLYARSAFEKMTLVHREGK